MYLLFYVGLFFIIRVCVGALFVLTAQKVENQTAFYFGTDLMWCSCLQSSVIWCGIYCKSIHLTKVWLLVIQE